MTKNQRRTLDEWKEIIDRADSSGLHQKAFCEKEGVNYWSMRNAIATLKNQKSPQTTTPKKRQPIFKEIRVAPDLASGSAALSITMVKLGLPASYPPSQLAVLISEITS